jgi:MoaA/NifB/PqqE/SkfB family radical SAM enzyme
MIPRVREVNSALRRGERAQGKTRLSALPAELQIEATNRCGRSCPTCARNYYNRAANPPVDLTPVLLGRLAPLFPYAERVLVGGYGEPLLAEITPAIVARAHEAGCATTVLTSGVELTEPLAARLARAGLDEIIFSVDGASDEALLQWRQNTWDRVADALALLRRRLPRLRAAFNVTLHLGNLDDLPGIVQRASELAVTAIAVHHQKLYTRAHAAWSVLSDPARAGAAFERATLSAQLHGLALTLPPLSGQTVCEQPFRLMAIRADGFAQGCCSALFEGDQPRVPLGRITKKAPADLWNEPPIVLARAAMLGQATMPPSCARCAFRIFTVAAHRRFLDGRRDD